MFTFESLARHAEDYAVEVSAEFTGQWREFISWAEGKQTDQDADDAARKRLESHGYTVTKATS